MKSLENEKMRIREKDVPRAEFIGYTVSETPSLIAVGVGAWGPLSVMKLAYFSRTRFVFTPV